MEYRGTAVTTFLAACFSHRQYVERSQTLYSLQMLWELHMYVHNVCSQICFALRQPEMMIVWFSMLQENESASR